MVEVIDVALRHYTLSLYHEDTLIDHMYMLLLFAISIIYRHDKHFAMLQSCHYLFIFYLEATQVYSVGKVLTFHFSVSKFI